MVYFWGKCHLLCSLYRTNMFFLNRVLSALLLFTFAVLSQLFFFWAPNFLLLRICAYIFLDNTLHWKFLSFVSRHWYIFFKIWSSCKYCVRIMDKPQYFFSIFVDTSLIEYYAVHSCFYVDWRILYHIHKY